MVRRGSVEERRDTPAISEHTRIIRRSRGEKSPRQLAAPCPLTVIGGAGINYETQGCVIFGTALPKDLKQWAMDA